MIKSIIDRFGLDFFMSSLTAEQMNEYDSSKYLVQYPEHFKFMDDFVNMDDVVLILIQNGMLTDVDVSSKSFFEKLNMLLGMLPIKDVSFDFDSKVFSKLVLTYMDILKFETKSYDDDIFSNTTSSDGSNDIIFKILDENSINILSKCSGIIDENSSNNKQKEVLYSLLCSNEENNIKSIINGSIIDVKILNSVSTYDILKQYGFDILKHLHMNNIALISLHDESMKCVKIYPICNNRYMKELIEM